MEKPAAPPATAHYRRSRAGHTSAPHPRSHHAAPAAPPDRRHRSRRGGDHPDRHDGDGGTNHPVNGLGYRSHSVTKHCFVGYDVQWTRITDNTTGVSGYVPPRYLGNGNFDIGMR
ncbi:hypothetical protein [Streptomyces sp. TRM68367]|uniref:hypothetical protein n=1 Tax=Streptomyces sp. TRM68367 TaxID=2758415 RepID=UPI00165BC487|nr:hypothetical protein [Streptomyces sp. TRM68367]MBC9730394.1 hypothetical protein [Streptomyces sp. TRM68367]